MTYLFPTIRDGRGAARLRGDSCPPSRRGVVPATEWLGYAAVRRSGLTLMELLVVVTIIAILAAVTIPVMVADLEGRRIREAARGVSTFLAGARARAIETGRPAGVHFELLPNSTTAAMTMFYVEEPPPYAGLSTGSTVRLTSETSATLSESPPSGVVQPGDMLKVNYREPLYLITAVSGTTLTITSKLGSPDIAPGMANADLPYQIFRQPVSTSSAPYQLPDGTVIDLGQSGSDAQPSGTFPRKIMFSPSGGVSRVYNSDNSILNSLGTIFLLISKPDQAAAGTSLVEPDSLSNRWVAISPQTGQAKAAEVASGSDPRAFARDQGVLGGQ